MKKWKIFYLILVMSTCVLGTCIVYGDNIENKVADWGYSLGLGIKNASEKINADKNANIVSYVNDMPVYEEEIIERIEKNKAILEDMKAFDNSAMLPWEANPFEYVYGGKFMLSYARDNGIEVSKEELEEHISYEKNVWEAEKEVFEQYLYGRGITEDLTNGETHEEL